MKEYLGRENVRLPVEEIGRLRVERFVAVLDHSVERPLPGQETMGRFMEADEPLLHFDQALIEIDEAGACMKQAHDLGKRALQNAAGLFRRRADLREKTWRQEIFGDLFDLRHRHDAVDGRRKHTERACFPQRALGFSPDGGLLAGR